MKRLVLSLSVVAILIASYCVWEAIFVHRILQKTDAEFEIIENSGSLQEVGEAGERIRSHLEKRSFLLQLMWARDVIDPVRAHYIRFSEYTRRGDLREAKVAAREMKNALRDIRAVFP